MTEMTHVHAVRVRRFGLMLSSNIIFALLGIHFPSGCRTKIVSIFPNSPILHSLPISYSLFIYLWLCNHFLDLGRFISFLILYTVGGTPWTGDQPVARTIPTQRTTQTQNKRTQTSIHRVGFEPMIPVFERVKVVLVLDCAATMIGTPSFDHSDNER
jgi:hypothetical protein